MKILNFGSLNIDYVYRVPHFVRPGETLASFDRHIRCGGKGLNQSIALRSSGAEVMHAGCVGREGGDMLIRLLQSRGVDTGLVRVKDVPCGHTVIQVNDSGENCILLYGGANREIDETMIDEALAAALAGDLLVMQNEISQMPLLMTKAYAKGLKLILNASPMEGVRENLPLETVDMFFLNEHEAAMLAGTDQDPETVLAQQYPAATFIITYGARGAAMTTPDAKRYWVDGIKTNVIDTTGAGDTFLGYFVGRMSLGATAMECLRYAAQAASLCIGRNGAAASVPSLSQVEQALRNAGDIEPQVI